VNLLILVVDDEPDVEMLFRQQFRHDLRAGRFTMEFAPSGDRALQRIADAAGVSIILILSDINMPGMTGLELLPKAKAVRPDVPVIMITAYGDAETKRKGGRRGGAFYKAHRLWAAAQRNRYAGRMRRMICLLMAQRGQSNRTRACALLERIAEGDGISIRVEPLMINTS
jgi:CheY-like chemotaxis protein